MKCPSCGYENSEDARYCSLCQVSFAKANTELPGLAPLQGLKPEPSQEAQKTVQKILRSQPKGLNWFQRHLNWTWVLPQLFLFVTALVVVFWLTMSILGDIMSPLGVSSMLPSSGWFLEFNIIISLLGVASVWVVGAWVLKKKDRSPWWLLIFLIPPSAVLLHTAPLLSIFLGFGATVAVWVAFLRLENRDLLEELPQSPERPQTSGSIQLGLAPPGLGAQSRKYGP